MDSYAEQPDDDYLRQLEIENEQLRRRLQAYQQEREKYKLDAVREFLSRLSHDVRTPLTAIHNSIDILYKLTDEQRRLHHLTLIKMQVEHMEQLFFDIYSAARIDTEVTTYDLQRVYISSLLNVLMTQHMPAFSEKKQTVTCEISEDLPRVLADEVKLSHAFARLIQNAIQYTPDGGMITVRAWLEEEYLTVEIADSGIGISSEALPHIFEAFYREDEARNAQTGRTGLGLTIASKIIQSHGGWIDVESQPGVGSAFRVYLPPLKVPG